MHLVEGEGGGRGRLTSGNVDTIGGDDNNTNKDTGIAPSSGVEVNPAVMLPIGTTEVDSNLPEHLVH